MELARTRAKDAKATHDRVIPEEHDFDELFDFCEDMLKATTNTPPKRPYRQSSMDFLLTDRLDLKNNDSINR
jgi:hypothetical protein